MKRVGVIGLGDMGSGLAKNLIAHGFETTGFDLSAARLRALAEIGGHAAQSVAEVAASADAVYVMVMTGDQAKSVILGPEGLAARMPSGGGHHPKRHDQTKRSARHWRCDAGRRCRVD